MAQAWLALQKGAEGFSRPVVIKKLQRHQFRDNLVQEAKILSRLNHPQLVQVIDLEDRDGELLLVLEWVDGLNLAQVRELFLQGSLAKEIHAIAIWIFCFIVHQVLTALEYCHEQQPAVIHGDVTPQNILISRQGTVKLADFGIANAAKGYGNPAYAAPEIQRGQQANQESDIFQVSQVFMELLQILPASAGLKELRHWLRKGLAPKGSERFASALIMRQELVAWLDEKIKNSLWLSQAEKELGKLVSMVTLDSAQIESPAQQKTQPLEPEILTPRPKVSVPWFYIGGSCLVLLASLFFLVFWKTKRPMPALQQSPLVSPALEQVLPVHPAETPARTVQKKVVLEVQARPWGVVFVNTVRKGITPQVMELDAGSYTVEIVNPEMKVRQTRNVVLKPGSRQKILVNLNSR